MKNKYKRYSGSLITIEGISGMGKTYYFNLLKKMHKDNPKIIFNGEINDQKHTSVNQKIYDILSSKKSRFFDNGNPIMETLLIAAKQCNDEKNFVIPAICDGKKVLSDRGFDTLCVLEALIYSYRNNEDSKKIINLFYKSLGKICVIPRYTILFVGDCDKAIKRAEKRDKKKYTKIEKELLYNSYEWFYKIAKKNKKRFFIVNVDELNENEIISKINSIILN